MLTKKDWEDALRVQDACNLIGVARSFSQIMVKIREEADARGEGTEWINHHPIAVMFASKIASLTHCEDVVAFGKAYEAVETAIKAFEDNEEVA